MQRFKYICDPLFLVGCVAYAINRWTIKPNVTVEFMQYYFNDLWLIPCALPPVLWLHRRLRLRSHNEMPQVSEITFHLAFWSALCEWIGPKFILHAAGDPMDVIAYTLGAVLSGLWWQRRRWLNPSVPHEF